jgi:hypothetical protein
MDDRFVRLYAYDRVKDPGVRLRLEHDPVCGCATLACERVLPEQVDNPDARNVVNLGSIDLTTAEVKWLASVGVQLAEMMEAADVAAQASLDARVKPVLP